MPSFYLRFVGSDTLPKSLSKREVEECFGLSAEDIHELRPPRFRGTARLGAAVQLVMLRTTGRHPDALSGLPPVLLRHLTSTLGMSATDIASVTSLYKDRDTRFEHQLWARQRVGFAVLADTTKALLADALRELATTAVSVNDLVHQSEHWLFDRRLVLPGDRALRDMARTAFADQENAALETIRSGVPREHIHRALLHAFSKRSGPGGHTVLEWLRTPPGKHGQLTLSEVTKKIECLKALHVHEWRLSAIALNRLKAYSQEVVNRPPSATKNLSPECKHASADGTKWNLYEQNLLSEHHIRYGGYGGIGYYHVSDKFIALFSHFISCGTYEGIHILDGLMTNESDIRPDTIHGDTQAQSYPVFALAHLLGIQLMPRIRGIQDLKFHRPEPGNVYRNINALFSDVIDWRLIELHLPAMLRVAVSIKTGKITPSAILRRLGTYSRKNKLYFAFVELGKVIRTMFLLSYIGDVGLRKVIHAETNKSEQFNGFAQWSFFGGEGIIAENIRHEQRKVIKYNHLVANMIILHNVVGMTKVLQELRDEGTEITLEILGGLAPFRTAHINRFGDYTLDFRRKIGPLNFDATIIPMES